LAAQLGAPESPPKTVVVAGDPACPDEPDPDELEAPPFCPPPFPEIPEAPGSALQPAVPDELPHAAATTSEAASHGGASARATTRKRTFVASARFRMAYITQGSRGGQ
jgi:hypothetical protein